ncbi:MAG TPA: hypothetical protein VHM91_24830 [Verrucomicrobiales bacterium]|nr:hypothetical protein [Verrucomicrobiales bacterium]
MTVPLWRKTAFALMAIMILVVLVLVVQLMERMTVADQLRDAAQSEEKLGRRVYDDGTYIVQEMLSAILRAGVPGEDADAMQADKDRMKTLQDRAEKVFSSPPLELSQEEKDVFKTVLEDLRLHREQTEAWLASIPAERLAALPELDESRNTLLNDVNKLIGVRSEKLLRQVNDLRDSSHGTRWLLLLTSLVFAALLGGTLRAVHMGWVRPLALKAATADRLAASSAARSARSSASSRRPWPARRSWASTRSTPAPTSSSWTPSCRASRRSAPRAPSRSTS